MSRSLTPFIRQEDIADRMRTLAAEVAAALPPCPGGLVMVGPLKGCVVFMADLSRALWGEGVPHTLDFLRLASYGDGTESSGVVRLEYGLLHSVDGRHVLLVDDIVDTGRTLAFAQTYLADRGATGITTAVLMDKPARRRVAVPVDHVGFTIPDAFVVGYGCDLAERYRELPFVGLLGPEEGTA